MKKSLILLVTALVLIFAAGIVLKRGQSRHHTSIKLQLGAEEAYSYIVNLKQWPDWYTDHPEENCNFTGIEGIVGSQINCGSKGYKLVELLEPENLILQTIVNGHPQSLIKINISSISGDTTIISCGPDLEHTGFFSNLFLGLLSSSNCPDSNSLNKLKAYLEG